MDQIEYIGKIMDDGHIFVPDAVRRQLNLVPDSSVHVILSVTETKDVDPNLGWSIFRAMGREEQSGCLSNASENHDRYLYEKQS